MLFSDRGAWHGYRWADNALFEWQLLTDGTTGRINSSVPVLGRLTHDDRLEAVVPGGMISLRFLDARTAEIRVPREAVLASDPGGLDFVAVGPGRYRHILTNGPATSGTSLLGLPRTLRWNWREPLGDVRHAGIVSSPHAYRGFRTSEAWSQAAVLPKDLARDQIAAVFDHQRNDGMVPEAVLPDARANNWRCSATPLSAWACHKHPGLLEEFRPQVLRYHGWWGMHRRPPGERLYAYGGRDLVASKWESSWENSTRYDNVVLLGEVQNVLSVDLCSYLCLEKRLLGIPDPDLERLANEVLFHDGAFYDVAWPTHRPVKTLTAATWIPLWCGIATPDRAHSVIELMRDPDHFDTPVPFPTVARSDPGFDPDGQWRGSVEMQHAARAIEVMARYGHHREARHAAERLLSLDADWEWYNPLTGEPARGARPAVPQFSRTAAARIAIRRVLDRLPA